MESVAVMNSELLNNIPAELRDQKLWLKSKDKKAQGFWKTDADKETHCRTLAQLVAKPDVVEVQRLIVKDEPYIYIDLDKCRDAETGETEPWALKLIEDFDTYTEYSRSKTGYHLVCRGSLTEDDWGHGPPTQIEIKSGNTKNLLNVWTGDLIDDFLYRTIEDRQEKAVKLLKRVQKAGKVSGAVAHAEPVDWRKKFHTVDELPDGDIRFLIENVLPEGVAFIGALSGAGKTWLCLSMARALTTGKKFLGNHTVSEPVNVLYLCPEMNAKTFKKRCRLFGISERFRCMTISDGVPLDLDDESLAIAIGELKPVVFLDTAIRFSNIEDENSSSQNAQGLAKAVFRLLHIGAQAVVCLHHRPKAGAQEELTLENTLRGTGDLGAICDVVWGLQYEKGNSEQYAKESRQFVRLQMRCVKARDFSTPDDSRIQLFPFVEEIGDFAVLEGDAETTSKARKQSEVEKLDAAIAQNPSISRLALQSATGIGRNRIQKLAAECGWIQNTTTSKWEKKSNELAF
jgi:hypothetical protein